MMNNEWCMTNDNADHDGYHSGHYYGNNKMSSLTTAYAAHAAYVVYRLVGFSAKFASCSECTKPVAKFNFLPVLNLKSNLAKQLPAIYHGIFDFSTQEIWCSDMFLLAEMDRCDRGSYCWRKRANSLALGAGVEDQFNGFGRPVYQSHLWVNT